MHKGFLLAVMLLASTGLAAAKEGTQAKQQGHGHTHGHAHAHGKADLELIVEGRMIKGEFRTPMDSLLGFEHAPKTEGQKKAVAHLQQLLLNPSVILQPTPQAQCAALHQEAISPMFSGAVSGEHSDLVYRFSFECQAPQKLTGVQFHAFKQFKRLSEIRVQLVTPKAQRAAVIRKKDPRLAFPE